MAAPNLSVSYGERPEQLLISGRVTAAGASNNVVGTSSVVLPARWAVTQASTGVYNIVFTDNFAAFLGASVDIEASAIPSASTSIIGSVYNWTPATRTLQVLTFNSASTPVATNAAFTFVANFCDSTAP